MSIPHDRSNHAAVTVGDDIFILGGEKEVVNDDTTVKDCEKYSIKENKCSEIAPMLNTRYGFGAAAYSGKVYIAGGFRFSYEGRDWRVSIKNLLKKSSSLKFKLVFRSWWTESEYIMFNLKPMILENGIFEH